MPKTLVLSMPYSSRLGILGSGIALAILGSVPTASAQISPGGGFGPSQPAGEQKKEGVAEAAPKTPGLLPTTPALPAPKGRRKQWKLIEIDGYFRLRTDWFKNFHQGFIDNPALGGAAFPRSLSCSSPLQGSGCDDTLSSTNMRLRLEPTINLSEGTSVFIQADILDNLVLGSTPINENYGGPFNTYTDPSSRPPLGAFGNVQQPPQAGFNADRDSILIKRAWAQVALPLGLLKVGRMPNHWGMGIFANAGSLDPVSGVYDYESDFGDTVDRVSFSTVIPGTQLRAMVASDWASTRLASYQTPAGRGREGQPWDLDDGDDANSWVFVVSRMDSPQEFKDKVDRGDVALNYGVYFEYKTQDFDLDLSDFQLGSNLDRAAYVARGYKAYSPSLWAKLGVGRIQLEAEAVAQLGKIDRLDEFDFISKADIRKYGGVGRFVFRGLENKLRLGLESGFASGDQHDNSIPGNIHFTYANLIGTPNDTRLTQFIFNREYKIDMILWRYLIGAVTNAGYVKPFLSYDLTKAISFRASNITSFALKPVATPGNSTMYGTEFNADIGYRTGGLYFSIAYGVLFPFGALNHPVAQQAGASFGFINDGMGNDNTGEAGTSHVIQSRLVLTF
jgi:uncharacterized protein (TIGR04551 family)